MEGPTRQAENDRRGLLDFQSGVSGPKHRQTEVDASSRDSSTRAVKDARGGAAVKSRQSMGLSFSTLYFHVLERSWLFCAGVLAVVFTLALGMSALLCLAVGGFDDHQGSRTAPLRFAASHVFTMGFGTVQPRTDLSYALAW